MGIEEVHATKTRRRWKRRQKGTTPTRTALRDTAQRIIDDLEDQGVDIKRAKQLAGIALAVLVLVTAAIENNLV
jgi:methionine synthase II (cobalamin-independent)